MLQTERIHSNGGRFVDVVNRLKNHVIDMGKTITLGQFLMGLVATFLSLGGVVWNQAQNDAKIRADVDNLQKMRESDEQWKRDVISQIREVQIENRAYQRRADDNFTQILVNLRDKQDRK